MDDCKCDNIKNLKKNPWGRYIEHFLDALKKKRKKVSTLFDPFKGVNTKLSSDDMVRYANNLHTLWECSKKIIGSFQGPFLGHEVLVKHVQICH